MNETSLKRGNVRGELKAERNVLEKVINGSFVKLIVGIRREREREREKEGLYVGLRVPSLGIEWDGNSNGGVNNF